MNNHPSTGPRSAEGKAVSSRNALKSGIYAKAETVLAWEKVEALETLAAEYYDRFAPTTPEQRCLVDALVSDEWLLRRFRAIEAQLLTDTVLGDYMETKPRPLGDAYYHRAEPLDRLQRRVNTTRRNFRQTLELLRKLQAETEPAQPPAPIPQFVPSDLPQIVPTLPSPPPPPSPAPGIPLPPSECPPLQASLK